MAGCGSERLAADYTTVSLCDRSDGVSLYEECLYNDKGHLLNGNLADYLVPMAVELPDIEVGHVESRTFDSDLGAKGAGVDGAGGAVLAEVAAAALPLELRDRLGLATRALREGGGGRGR